MAAKRSGGFFEKFATLIVDKRNLIIILYVFALIFSLIAMGWVNVENDVTKYLMKIPKPDRGLMP